ncbi:CCHC-type domain-containing protein [Abeliophyllum distichum]|uniref:CCHC-type domain-containing protein n=1 Tax=Abeliophyllum distichum TaxID=126358 RepID=A0ABD1UJF0_9LAMI
MFDDQKVEAGELAYTSIILHLSDSVLRKIGTIDDAQSLWETLESTYLEKSLPNKLFLLEKFFSFKIDSSKDLDENVDVFNKLIQDIKNCSDKGIDEYKAIILLNAIPEAYKDVKSAIKYGRDDLTVDMIINSLRSKSHELKNDKETRSNGEGLYVRGRSQHRQSNNQESNNLNGQGHKKKAFLRVSDAAKESDLELKVWVKQVRDVAYDTEDIIDEFILHQHMNVITGVESVVSLRNCFLH